MNKLKFWFNQLIGTTDLSTLQTNIENADKNMAKDIIGAGIVNGLDIVPNSPADLFIKFLHGLAYDAYGQRIDVPGDGTKDCSTYIPVIADNERWLTVVAKFARNDYEPHLDGEGNTVLYKNDESYEIAILAGEIASTGTAVKPAAAVGEVILADVLVSYGQTSIELDDINLARRMLSRTESISDVMIGNRTLNSALTGGNDTGSLTQLLSWIVRQIQAMTGKPNWYDTTNKAGESEIHLTVAPGETVTAQDVVRMINGGIKKVNNALLGNPVVFESASTYLISACALDSDRVLVVYQDVGNSGYGTAVVLTISGSTITAGAPVVFVSANAGAISACVLDSGRVLVAYNDGNNSGYGTAVVLTISGSTITVGIPVVFESTSVGYVSTCALDSGKALVAYKDVGNSNYGTAVILTISGSTITAGTPVVFKNAGVGYVSICALDSARVLVGYQDVGNSNYGTAVILTISGSTITVGTLMVFESANTNFISVCALDSGKALVTYKDVGNSNYGTAVVLTISGSTITAGTPVVFESATTNHSSVCVLGSDRVLVVYQDAGNSNYGTAVVLTISGFTITVGTPVVFESASTLYTFACLLDSGRVLVVYQDAGNSNYGTAVVIDTIRPVVGLALESKTGEETCRVAVGPIIPGLSGLAQGSVYYLDNTGTLITTGTSRQIGIALSTTELLWQPARLYSDI